MNTKSNVGEKTKFRCVTCGIYSKSQYNLNNHIRTHTGEKPYRCDDCGKEFVKNWDLKIHTRTHTGEKLYECEECGKTFAQISYLNTHVRAIHTREKNYRCDDCGKEFVTKVELKSHTRSHTGEKPYGCKECGKTFAQRHHLKIHTRTHTGENPYCCKVCGKTFTQKSNLNKHIRRIHSGVIPHYQCDVCEITFADKSNLSTHIQEVHIKTSTNNLQNKGDSNESVMGNPSSSSVNLIFDSNATSNYNYSELNWSPSYNHQAIIMVPNEIQKDKYVLPHLYNVPCPNPIIYQSEAQSHSHDAQTNNTFNDNMMMTPSPSINSHLTDESVSESLLSTLDIYQSR